MEWRCADTFGVTILGVYVSIHRRPTIYRDLPSTGLFFLSSSQRTDGYGASRAFDAPSLSTTARKRDVEYPGQFRTPQRRPAAATTTSMPVGTYLEQGFSSVTILLAKYLAGTYQSPLLSPSPTLLKFKSRTTMTC